MIQRTASALGLIAAFTATLALTESSFAQTPIYDYDAELDTTTNNFWENSATLQDRTWQFNTTASPINVTSFFSGISKAYEFNNSLTGGTTTSFNGSGIDGTTDANASWEFWIKPDTLSQQSFIFETGGGVHGAAVVLDNGSIKFVARESNTSTQANFNLGSSLSNDFIQVVAINNGTANQLEIYVDGRLQATTNNARDWSLGGNAAGLARINSDAPAFTSFDSFDGQMAQARFYDSVLSTVEVVETYRGQAGFTAVAGATVNLDAALDPGGDNTWVDLAGNRDGTFAAPSSPDVVNANDTNWGLLTHSYSDNKANQTNYNSLNSDQNATFEIFFRPDNVDVSNKLTLWETGGTGDGSSFTLDGSNLQFAVISNGSQLRTASVDISPYFTIAGGGAITKGDFLHAAATVNLTTDSISLFLNGRPVTATLAGSGNIDDWSGGDGAALFGRGQNDVGGLGNAYNNNFTGDISLFRVYGGSSGTILTPDQIAGNFAAATGYNKVFQNDGGDWQTSGDWTPSGPPTGTDNALIDVGVTANLTSGIADASNLLLRGTLDWQGNSTLAANRLIVDGGTLEVSSGPAKTFGNSVEVSDVMGPGAIFNIADVTGNANSDLTLSGTISGPGGLTKVGNGTLELSGAIGYTGVTVIENGTLVFDTGGAVSLESFLDLQTGGTFQVASGNVKIDVASGDALKLNTGGANTATIQVDAGASVEIADNIGLNQSTLIVTGDGDGLISGSVASGGGGAGSGNNFIKNGNGTWTLTNDNNNMNGTYTVNDGVLQIGDGGSTGELGNSTIAISNGGTLLFNHNDHQQQRAASTLAQLQSSVPLLAELSNAQIADWYVDWRHHLSLSLQNLSESIEQSRETTPVAELATQRALLKRLQKEQDEFEERLQVSGGQEHNRFPSDRWNSVLALASYSDRWTFPGAAPEIAIKLEATPSFSLSSRLPFALLFSIAFAVCIFSSNCRSWLARAFDSRGELILATAALLLAAICTVTWPAWLGLAIACVIATARLARWVDEQ